MSVKVYGCNHVPIEVDDVEKAVAFYQDVFNLEKLDAGEGWRRLRDNWEYSQVLRAGQSVAGRFTCRATNGQRSSDAG